MAFVYVVKTAIKTPRNLYINGGPENWLRRDFLLDFALVATPQTTCGTIIKAVPHGPEHAVIRRGKFPGLPLSVGMLQYCQSVRAICVSDTYVKTRLSSLFFAIFCTSVSLYCMLAPPTALSSTAVDNNAGSRRVAKPKHNWHITEFTPCM